MPTKRTVIKSIAFLVFFILLSLAAYGAFFVWKADKTKNKMTIFPGEKENIFDPLKSFSRSKQINLKGVEQNRINILFLGIAGKGKPGQNLTDTIMVASVNPQTHQVALLSLPRDLYIKTPDDNVFMKINSLYQFSLNRFSGDEQKASRAIKRTISDVTGMDINYYVTINFEAFTRIVDAIGGVNVMNERDLYDPRYPGPNYSYETFELKKGFHRLDGATALKYARERHNDPEGDFGRAKRQQQILEATKSKIFSAGTLVNVFAANEILNALGDNVKTDIRPEEFEDFWELTKEANTNNINNVVIDAWNKDSLLKVSHVFYGNVRAFVLVPRIGNWSEIRDISENIFDLNKIKRRKEEIIRENATVIIINKSAFRPLSDKIKSLLGENLGYKNVIIVNDPSNYTESQTTVYDFTKGTKPFTLDELIAKIPAQRKESLDEKYQKVIQNTSPDAVLVLGKDIVEKYNMEEDSFEEYNKASDTNEYTEFLNK